MSPLCYYIYRSKETKLMKQIGGNNMMKDAIKTSSCIYGRVIYGKDCKSCEEYEKCAFINKGKVKKKNEKLGVIPSD